MLRRALEKEGHEVIEATNGKHCLEMLENHQPDCLFLDLLMPEMNGYEVLEALQHQGKHLPVVVVTADIQDTSRERCLNLGAIAVLNKPPKPQELKIILQHIQIINGGDC
ncbi:response regulator [Spirulina subsalsa FACHB-351]|uniref:Response regulator n=2 Tax=Spirulina subsalsa TaxID=54311 RepID=A0ABT3L913_9CYAN|nr:response regulator [Spirulina subsalsa FACHB-351]